MIAHQPICQKEIIELKIFIMEKIFCNKRLLVIAFFTVFSTTAAPAALTSNNHHTIPVELKFVRWINDQPLFQFSFSANQEQDVFTIIIKDEFRNELYRENITGENFTKAFLLNTEEIGDDELQLEIVSKKTNRSTWFTINRHSFIEEKIAIS
jgi:hypothetical protein